MSVKPLQGKLDHRIASAEGSAQAEIHRREKAERMLDRTLEDLELIQLAAYNLLLQLGPTRSRLPEPAGHSAAMTAWLHHVATARAELQDATLTAQRRLRRYNHIPTPTNDTPALAADATRSTPA